jgi:transposase InsO family protein
MSTEEKVSLVHQVQEEHGLSSALAALQLPRSTWYYHQNHRVPYTEKYAYLKKPLEAIARIHHEYGYRRTTPELREVYGFIVNHKVVQRLHQEWDLPLIRGTRPPKISGIRKAIEAAGERINLVAGRETIQAFEVAYTDFTELVYANGRLKAYLIPIIDHTSKLILGWAVGKRAVTSLALEAWEQARDTFRYQGFDLEGVTVHHDQDPVFTSYGWTSQLLLKDHVRVSYALNGARDNPEMEAFNSRFKTENRSLLLDAQTLEELQVLVSERMDYYNNERRHSSIDYQAPVVFIASLCHGRNITIPMG